MDNTINFSHIFRTFVANIPDVAINQIGQAGVETLKESPGIIEGLKTILSNTGNSLLDNISERICTSEFVSKLLEDHNPALKLLGRFLPDPNAEWVQAAIENDANTLFAQGVGGNAKLDPNAKWVKAAIANNANTRFASGVGGNAKFNPNLKWVKAAIENDKDSLFAREVGGNAYAQLKLLLAADMKEINRALESDTAKARQTLIGQMLLAA